MQQAEDACDIGWVGSKHRREQKKLKKSVPEGMLATVNIAAAPHMLGGSARGSRRLALEPGQDRRDPRGHKGHETANAVQMHLRTLESVASLIICPTPIRRGRLKRVKQGFAQLSGRRPQWHIQSHRSRTRPRRDQRTWLCNRRKDFEVDRRMVRRIVDYLHPAPTWSTPGSQHLDLSTGHIAPTQYQSKIPVQRHRSYTLVEYLQAG